jgi:peptidoglycan hydrolase-like protein with peptidoglycan-binding domain
VIQVPAASSFGIFAVLAFSAWAAPQQSSTTTAHKKTSPALHHSKSTLQTKSTAKTAATTAPVKHSPAAKTNVAKTTAKKRPVTAHRAPQQPSPERYKEIQTALAAKGYFAGEPDGNWGPGSVDALKRFQHDQNLTEDGKIGSLSLIALGHGPKREPVADPQKSVEPEQKIP